MRPILLLTLLAGCGSDTKSGNQAAPAPAVTQPATDPATVPTTLPAVAGDTTQATATPTTLPKPSLLSLAVPAAANLPACTEANNLQLAYVLATKEFQTCQDGAWVKIDIEAPAPVVVPPTPEEAWQTVAAVELGAKWLAIKDQISPFLAEPTSLSVVAGVTPCADRRPGESTYTRYTTKNLGTAYVVLNVFAGVVVKIDKEHTSNDLSITSATAGECQLYFP